jgi:hypothetical protein
VFCAFWDDISGVGVVLAFACVLCLVWFALWAFEILVSGFWGFGIHNERKFLPL